eukprot:9136177-Pyramimonas_sp.AAC.1
MFHSFLVLHQLRVVAAPRVETGVRTEVREVPHDELDLMDENLVMDSSIFLQRRQEAECQAYVHDARFVVKIFVHDWERVMRHEAFTAAIESDYKLMHKAPASKQ